MNGTPTTYDSAAFGLVDRQRGRIRAVAATLALTPESIYGALVEEHHAYRASRAVNWLGDFWTMSHAGNHGMLALEYRQAAGAGKLDRHSTLDKVNPVLNDTGPYNIKLGTAIRLLETYLRDTPADEDPLGLRRFADDYPALARGLADGEVAPEIAGLMLQEADRYMRAHVDRQEWEQKTPSERDALLITYYNLGPALIDERRQLNIAQHDGKYRPQIGQKEAGGETHLANAARIGQAFDHAGYQPATPPPATMRPVAAPTATATAARAPSASFVTRLDTHTVRLAPGGTLSDVVVLERARGNPLSLGDLRAFNGIAAGDERRLPAGMLLTIPQRDGNRLTAGDDTTRMEIDRRNGNVQLTRQAPDGRSDRLTIIWNERERCHHMTATLGDRPPVHARRDDTYRRRWQAMLGAQPVTMIPVVSGNIARVGHDPVTLTLTVAFVSGGLYEYYLVPVGVFAALLAAPSKGRFLHREIKGRYPYARLDRLTR